MDLDMDLEKIFWILIVGVGALSAFHFVKGLAQMALEAGFNVINEATQHGIIAVVFISVALLFGGKKISEIL